MITRSDIYYSQQSSWYWISNFCRTFDEHDQKGELRKFPAHWIFLKDRFCDPCDRALSEFHVKKECQKIIIPKSRQMMVSWTAAAWCLWLMCHYSNQLVLWMSKGKDDAVVQVNRIRRLYENLVDAEFWHRQFLLSRPLSRQKDSMLGMKNGSAVYAVPQGGEVIHSRVPTVVIADEFQFQEEAEASYKAALPCTQLLIMILTAEPSFAQRLVQDKDGEINEFAAVETV
jgi:hypothetical protein